MGNCAGCTNPQRRGNFRQQLTRPTYNSPQNIKTLKYNSPEYIKTIKQQQILKQTFKNYSQSSQFKLISSGHTQHDPIKSRIAYRSVKKYQRKPTLRQQQFRNHRDNTQIYEKASVKFPKQQTIAIRSQSLENSIVYRNQLSPSQARQRYKHQYKHQFHEDPQELKQIIQTSKQANNLTSYNPTPLNNYNRIQRFSQQSSITQIDKSQRYKSNSRYFPKKVDKYKEKQLSDIMQLAERDAQTPGYVKNIKKLNGEDVKMNNFLRFQPLGSFAWFQLGKYLGQIEKAEEGQQNFSQKLQKDKIKQAQFNDLKYQTTNPDISTQKKKPNLMIQTNQNLNSSQNNMQLRVR